MEQLGNMNIAVIWRICFEIHLSVQALFQDAGVAESTVMLQVAGKGYGTRIINLVGEEVKTTENKIHWPSWLNLLSLLAAGALICKPFKEPRNRFLGP